ncbi:MAG: PIN domain-containing protein [Candidatus Micrarchaeia archaeon]
MLFDTYAWIDFFKASRRGGRVKRYLKQKNILTSVVSVAEFTEWSFKQGISKEKTEKMLVFIEKNSAVLPVNFEVASLAGKISFLTKKQVKNWGMMDSMIYATALLNKTVLLTGDKHFSKMPFAELF